METPKEGSNAVANVAGAVTALVKAVPVYDDVLQPAAREVGKSLTTVVRAVNVALAPLSAMVWGYERISAYLEERLLQKLKRTPEERIVTPDPKLAGPLLESMRFTSDDGNLREMYANLLAVAMDRTTIQYAHPSYVEVIRQLSSDEALIVRGLAGLPTSPNVAHTIVEDAFGYVPFSDIYDRFKHLAVSFGVLYADLSSAYLDNLERLKVLEFRSYTRERLQSVDQSEYCAWKAEARDTERVVQTRGEDLLVSSFGLMFLRACTDSREKGGLEDQPSKV